MTNIIVDITGWIGGLLLVIAYYLNSKNKINAQSFSYQFLNVLGSLFLIVNTVFYGAYPSALVNVIWIFIGIRFLVKKKQ